ncbi:MAG: hypothetical protein ACOC33_02720 [bacterium]
MSRYFRYKKGGNIYHTYWIFWFGNLNITINKKKRPSIIKRIKKYFKRSRTITINI